MEEFVLDGNVSLSLERTTTACPDNVSWPLTVSASPPQQQLLSDATYETVMGFVTFVSMATGCLSVLCCLASGLVYARQLRNNTSAYYLLLLNAGDGMHSLCKMAFAVTEVILGRGHVVYFAMAFYVDAGAATIFRRTAVWMNAQTSVDRFLVIAFPLRARRRGGGGCRGPVLASAGVVCVVTAVHSYLFLRYELTTLTDSSWRARPTSLLLAHPEVFLAATQLGRALCFYLPLALSLVFNVALLVALRAHDVSARALLRTGDATSAARGSQEQRHSAAGQEEDTGDTANNSADKLGQKPDKGDKGDKSRGSADRTRLILTLTFVFLLLALPRVATASLPGVVIDAQRNLVFMLNAVGNVLTFCTDLVLLAVTLTHSKAFRTRLRRLVLRGKTAGPPASLTVSVMTVHSDVTSN